MLSTRTSVFGYVALAMFVAAVAATDDDGDDDGLRKYTGFKEFELRMDLCYTTGVGFSKSGWKACLYPFGFGLSLLSVFFSILYCCCCRRTTVIVLGHGSENSPLIQHIA